MSRQLEFDFGVTDEQACIMCHLSSGCPGCCRKCNKCGGQMCSLPFVEHEKARWDTWMHLVATALPELKRFIPKKFHKELKKHDTRRV